MRPGQAPGIRQRPSMWIYERSNARCIRFVIISLRLNGHPWRVCSCDGVDGTPLARSRTTRIAPAYHAETVPTRLDDVLHGNTCGLAGPAAACSLLGGSGAQHLHRKAPRLIRASLL